MTTAAQTTLLHAAEVLEHAAAVLHGRDGFVSPLGAAWDVKSVQQDAHDDALIAALELRLLAKHINGGQIAVSPAPIFERKENG
jgi:hypothetical protein